LDWI